MPCGHPECLKSMQNEAALARAIERGREWGRKKGYGTVVIVQQNVNGAYAYVEPTDSRIGTSFTEVTIVVTS